MRALGIALGVAAAACGTTGGDLVQFGVVARGAGTAALDNAFGWRVELSRAVLHIGAVYLNRSAPNSGAQATACILPGVYTAQELSALDVDVLSTAPQPFPAPGTGTDDEVVAGEIWLTGGDINAVSDDTAIVDLAGTATQGAQVVPFSARIQISSANRGLASTPGLPSLHPICKQRIVSPIRTDLVPHDGGTLTIAVDPSGWFATVDFATLPPGGAFPDDNTFSASSALFTAIRAATATFHMSFQ